MDAHRGWRPNGQTPLPRTALCAYNNGVGQTKSLVGPLVPDGTDPAKQPTVREYPDIVSPTCRTRPIL